MELSSETPERVMEISEGVNIDITKENKIVGIEILDASQKIDISTIFAYSLELDSDIFKKKVA